MSTNTSTSTSTSTNTIIPFERINKIVDTLPDTFRIPVEYVYVPIRDSYIEMYKYAYETSKQRPFLSLIIIMILLTIIVLGMGFLYREFYIKFNLVKSIFVESGNYDEFKQNMNHHLKEMKDEYIEILKDNVFFQNEKIQEGITTIKNTTEKAMTSANSTNSTNTDLVSLASGIPQNKPRVIKLNSNIYDDFYATIYDSLFHDPNRYEFEYETLKSLGGLSSWKGANSSNSLSDSEQISILDIGCGTGHRVNFISKDYPNVIGIDQSKSMLKKARLSYPTLNKEQLQLGNCLNSMLFKSNTFSHIMCMYFTIYTIEDKQLFFENCYKWLKPGGYLAVHLVNRDRFDPLLGPANPVHLASVQKYAKERITKSTIHFNTFDYRAEFIYKSGKDVAHFEEVMRDKQQHVRIQKQTLYMNSQSDILSIAKNNGFTLVGKDDMVKRLYEYQFIYVLQKTL